MKECMERCSGNPSGRLACVNILALADVWRIAANKADNRILFKGEEPARWTGVMDTCLASTGRSAYLSIVTLQER